MKRALQRTSARHQSETRTADAVALPAFAHASDRVDVGGWFSKMFKKNQETESAGLVDGWNFRLIV